MKSDRSFRKLWGIPVLLGILSFTGLIVALVYDGWGDALSWILLGIPVGTAFYFGKKIM